MASYTVKRFLNAFWEQLPEDHRSGKKLRDAFEDVLRRSAIHMDDAKTITKTEFCDILRSILGDDADIESLWIAFHASLYTRELYQAWLDAISTGEELLSVLLERNLICLREDNSAKLLVAHNKIDWSAYPDRRTFCDKKVTLGEALFDCLNALS